MILFGEEVGGAVEGIVAFPVSNLTSAASFVGDIDKLRRLGFAILKEEVRKFGGVGEDIAWAFLPIKDQ